jgi:hypothetical protein
MVRIVLTTSIRFVSNVIVLISLYYSRVIRMTMIL